jgi:hypothetical protein
LGGIASASGQSTSFCGRNDCLVSHIELWNSLAVIGFVAKSAGFSLEGT